MMNGQQFENYKREAYIASERYTNDSAIFSPIELEMMEESRWTDYQDVLIKDGFVQNHNISVNGGTENTKYSISTSYLKDEGIVPLQDFTRNNIRINFDHKFGKLRIGTSTIGTYSVRNGEDRNPFTYALRLNPLSRPYDKDGNLLLRTTPSTSSYNPLAMVDPEQNINKRKRFRLFSSIYGEVDIAKDITYRLNFGPDLIHSRVGSYLGSNTPQRREGSATANSNEGFQLNYTLENILTYNKTFADNHILDFTGLFSVQSHQSETSGINVLGVPANMMQYYNFNAAEEINGVQSNFTSWDILSGMARVNYNHDDRYLATITGRSDGSSRFGSNHKWGFFPSAALAWVMSNEEFMSNNSFWDMLKFRLSYGITGNTGISPYQTLGLLSRSSYDFGGIPAFGFSPSQIRNDNLKWEKTASFNAGVDFSIFNDRLSGNLEFYQQNTSDLLMQRQIPQTSGFGSVLENIGKTRNTGIEGMLSSIIVPADRLFNWSIDLNFAINREEIVELYGGKSDDIGNQWFIGEPSQVYYDYEKIGIWQLDEELEARSYDTRVGQIKVKDQNEDGRIDSEDRVILGSNRPKISGGLTTYFGLKRFNLSVNMYGSLGNMISSPFHNTHNTLFGRYNNLNVDYWTPDNPTNAYPQPYSDQERPLYNTTMAYFDGSYLKIRNIKLGYSIPQTLANKIQIRSLDIYISAQNAFIISPYVQSELGLDPENLTTSTPFTKSITMGLNISI